MHRLSLPLEAAFGQRLGAALQRLSNSSHPGSDLTPLLDIAVDMTRAHMGTLQRFDQGNDCLELGASRGFSSVTLNFFGIVRRDTNSSSAAAFTRRMRVFVEDISTSYLFVGTRELDILSAEGVAAIQSTPMISSAGRLRDVLTTHFREAKAENTLDHAPLDRLAVQIADFLEQREGPAPHQRDAGGSDRGD